MNPAHHLAHALKLPGAVRKFKEDLQATAVLEMDGTDNFSAVADILASHWHAVMVWSSGVQL